MTFLNNFSIFPCTVLYWNHYRVTFFNNTGILIFYKNANFVWLATQCE